MCQAVSDTPEIRSHDSHNIIAYKSSIFHIRQHPKVLYLYILLNSNNHSGRKIALYNLFTGEEAVAGTLSNLPQC